jgi:hypothetical protein
MTVFQPPLRGADLLLVHCLAFSSDGPSAYSRLQSVLGEELAHMLVFALSGGQGRRGSSSP